MQRADLVNTLRDREKAALKFAFSSAKKKCNPNVEVHHFLASLVQIDAEKKASLINEMSVERKLILKEILGKIDELPKNSSIIDFSEHIFELIHLAGVVYFREGLPTNVSFAHMVLAAKKDPGVWRIIASSSKTLGDAISLISEAKLFAIIARDEAENPAAKPSHTIDLSYKFFISYRRGRDNDSAGRLYDQLIKLVGHEKVFIDINSVAVGRNYLEAVNEAIDLCSAFLVIVGPGWLGDLKRLAAAKDPVRLEIEGALRSDGVKIVPILVGGADMPPIDALPQSIEEISYNSGVRLDHENFRDVVQAKVVPLID